MTTRHANKVVVALAGIAAILPLVGTTIFPQYAALLWGLTILVGLVALAIAVPQNSGTPQALRRNWLIILGVLLVFSLTVLLLSANFQP